MVYLFTLLNKSIQKKIYNSFLPKNSENSNSLKNRSNICYKTYFVQGKISLKMANLRRYFCSTALYL